MDCILPDGNVIAASSLHLKYIDPPSVARDWDDDMIAETSTSKTERTISTLYIVYVSYLMYVFHQHALFVDVRSDSMSTVPAEKSTSSVLVQP